MSRTGRTLVPLVVPLVVLVVGLGLASAPPLAQAAPSPTTRTELGGADYHEPPYGACYDLTWEQGLSSTTTPPPVSCDAEHTLMTVGVARIPKRIRWGSRDLVDFYDTRCSSALYTALGGNPKAAGMSAYDFWFFFPTRAERAMGARWVRCDVGKVHGTADMDPLPADLDVGPLPLARRDLRCLVGKKLVTTSCNHRHQWKAERVFALQFLAKTEAEYQGQGQRCGRLLRTRHYLFDGPSLGQWLAGNRYMTCFERD